MDRVLADVLCLGQCASAPVRTSLGQTVQSCRNDLSHPLWAIWRLASTTRRNFPHTSNTLLSRPATPQRNSSTLDLQIRRNLLILFTANGGQDDVGAQCDLLRG